jgi:hypothetical protein
MSAKTRKGNVSDSDYVLSKDQSDSSNGVVDYDDFNYDAGSPPAAAKILAVNATGDGLEWIDQTGSASTLASLTDTDIAAPNGGMMIVYHTSDNKWNDILMGGDCTMDENASVTISNKAVTRAMFAMNVDDTGGAVTNEIGTKIMTMTVDSVGAKDGSDDKEIDINFYYIDGTTTPVASHFLDRPVRFTISSSSGGPTPANDATFNSISVGTAIDGLTTSVFTAAPAGSNPAFTFKIRSATSNTYYLFAEGAGGFGLLVFDTAAASRAVDFTV